MMKCQLSTISMNSATWSTGLMLSSISSSWHTSRKLDRIVNMWRSLDLFCDEFSFLTILNLHFTNQCLFSHCTGHYKMIKSFFSSLNHDKSHDTWQGPLLRTTMAIETHERDQWGWQLWRREPGMENPVEIWGEPTPAVGWRRQWPTCPWICRGEIFPSGLWAWASLGQSSPVPWHQDRSWQLCKACR